jgi:RimJ/RimL family protein N-acetyltransferase
MRKEAFASLGNRQSPDARPFEGRFISLKPLRVASDAEGLFAASHAGGAGESFWRYMTVGPFADAASMSMWLHGRTAIPDMISYTVRDAAGGAIIGAISLMSIRPEHGVAELGAIWFSPASQRTKANTEANFMLLQYCFEILGYRRMEWKCDAENVKSRAAAERLGYTFEGIFRQHLVVKGANRDTAWYSMLDRDWPRVRTAMKHWLYDNDSVPLGTLLTARKP